MDDWDEEWGDEYDDEDRSCTHCQGTGRVPALDYEAIQGFDYFACEHCEKGLDSGFPPRR